MKHSSPTFWMIRSATARLFVLLLAIVFFCSNSFAQTDNVNLTSLHNYKAAAKSDDCPTCLSVGIQASIDFAKLHQSIPGAPPGYSASPYGTKVGFNAGVFASKGVLQLGPGYLGGMVGLEFIQKGAKLSEDGTTDKLGLNYIELPIDVLYQYQIQEIGSAFIGLGPYFAFGIGGKDKYDDGTTTTTTNSFGGSDGGKRFDFGLQFTGGFKLSGMASISLFYDLGLLNIANNAGGSAYNYHDKNGVFGINLGYWFGGLGK
jgi:hypothetical protein